MGLRPRQVAGGSGGPLRTLHSFLWGIWSFTKSKPAAKSLLAHLSQRKAIEKMVARHDLPAFDNLTTLKTLADEGPPKGTLYHYPNPYNHQILSIAAQPAPPKTAVQIYSQGLRRVFRSLLD